MTAEAFSEYLQEIVDFVVQDSGAKSHNIEDVCERKYEQHFAFYDPIEYMRALYSAYGVEAPR